MERAVIAAGLGLGAALVGLALACGAEHLNAAWYGAAGALPPPDPERATAIRALGGAFVALGATLAGLAARRRRSPPRTTIAGARGPGRGCKQSRTS